MAITIIGGRPFCPPARCRSSPPSNQLAARTDREEADATATVLDESERPAHRPSHGAGARPGSAARRRTQHDDPGLRIAHRKGGGTAHGARADGSRETGCIFAPRANQSTIGHQTVVRPTGQLVDLFTLFQGSGQNRPGSGLAMMHENHGARARRGGRPHRRRPGPARERNLATSRSDARRAQAVLLLDAGGSDRQCAALPQSQRDKYLARPGKHAHGHGESRPRRSEQESAEPRHRGRTARWLDVWRPARSPLRAWMFARRAGEVSRRYGRAARRDGP
jgi:hypothetical protein